VLRYLTLDIVGDTPTRPGDKAGDLPLDLVLTRLKNSAEDAPQYAGLVCVLMKRSTVDIFSPDG
jgi:hypothetical protein